MMDGGQGINSFEETAGGGLGARRPYVKPFLCDLDVVDTEGKDFPQPTENGGYYGPS